MHKEHIRMQAQKKMRGRYCREDEESKTIGQDRERRDQKMQGQ